MRVFPDNSRGVTMIELVVAIGIFALLSLGAAEIIITGFRSNAAIWEHLEVQRDARRAVQQVVNVVRQAETSSVGAYPVVSAGDNELIVYSNIDNNGYRERVRFFLDATTLKKGIVIPTGNPLSYVTSTEVITDVAKNVTNVSLGVPIFSYYNSAYTGSESAISQPVIVGDVRVIRVRLILDKNPSVLPSSYDVESFAQIRNLKLN